MSLSREQISTEVEVRYRMSILDDVAAALLAAVAAGCDAGASRVVLTKFHWAMEHRMKAFAQALEATQVQQQRRALHLPLNQVRRRS